MKDVKLGESGRVLIVNDGGKFSAIGNKCTHYGAPLVNGSVNVSFRLQFEPKPRLFVCLYCVCMFLLYHYTSIGNTAYSVIR